MMKAENVKAFDYHPSFSTMLIDHWRRFDLFAIREELAAAKMIHADANAVRITNSYDAYLRDPKLYMEHFDQILALCSSMKLGVICCLFNGWHDRVLDCGGVYLENLIPGFGWSWKEGFWAGYMSDMVLNHASDSRIVLWETCNKPFGCYSDQSRDNINQYLYETRWLRDLYCYVKKAETDTPVGISLREWYGEKLIEDVSRCCDYLILSPYYCNEILTANMMKSRFMSDDRIIKIMK